VLIAGEVIVLIARGTFPTETEQPMRLAGAGVRELGVLLYQNYMLPFEAASLILLVGLVGAVMLAKKNASE
jgi:NADH-quinone oxidoreductase subunit J